MTLNGSVCSQSGTALRCHFCSGAAVRRSGPRVITLWEDWQHFSMGGRELCLGTGETLSQSGQVTATESVSGSSQL